MAQMIREENRLSGAVAERHLVGAGSNGGSPHAAGSNSKRLSSTWSAPCRPSGASWGSGTIPHHLGQASGWVGDCGHAWRACTSMRRAAHPQSLARPPPPARPPQHTIAQQLSSHAGGLGGSHPAGRVLKHQAGSGGRGRGPAPRRHQEDVGRRLAGCHQVTCDARKEERAVLGRRAAVSRPGASPPRQASLEARCLQRSDLWVQHTPPQLVGAAASNTQHPEIESCVQSKRAPVTRWSKVLNSSWCSVVFSL